jgi:hypothetical protein
VTSCAMFLMKRFNRVRASEEIGEENLIVSFQTVSRYEMLTRAARQRTHASLSMKFFGGCRCATSSDHSTAPQESSLLRGKVSRIFRSCRHRRSTRTDAVTANKHYHRAVTATCRHGA